MKRALLLVLVGLGFGFAARAKADIPPPLPPAKADVAVTIEVDEKAKGPRLVLPNGVFTPPRVRPAPKTNSEPKTELPGESEDGLAEEMAPSNNKLLIAGVALTLSLTCGGFWLLRRNGKGSMTGLSLLIAAGATVLVGAVVVANAPPPLRRPVPEKPARFPSAYEGKAEVSFVYGQQPVRLILDKESYEKLKKGELKGAAPE